MEVDLRSQKEDADPRVAHQIEITGKLKKVNYENVGDA